MYDAAIARDTPRRWISNIKTWRHSRNRK